MLRSDRGDRMSLTPVSRMISGDVLQISPWLLHPCTAGEEQGTRKHCCLTAPSPAPLRRR